MNGTPSEDCWGCGSRVCLDKILCHAGFCKYQISAVLAGLRYRFACRSIPRFRGIRRRECNGRREHEIKIFGDPQSFVVAFLKAGPALEFPALDESVVVAYAGEDPANCVVFLDNIGPQSKGAGGIWNFSTADHVAAAAVQLSGTNRRHRVTKRWQGSIGSSFA